MGKTNDASRPQGQEHATVGTTPPRQTFYFGNAQQRKRRQRSVPWWRSSSPICLFLVISVGILLGTGGTLLIQSPAHRVFLEDAMSRVQAAVARLPINPFMGQRPTAEESRYAELVGSIGELREAFNELGKQHKRSLAQAEARFMERIELLEIQHEEDSAANHDLLRAVQSLTEQLTSSNEGLIEAQGQISQLRGDVAGLQKQIDVSDQWIAHLRQQVSAVQDQNAEENQAIVRLNALVNAMERRGSGDGEA